jgi:hypothetical protein
MSNTLTGLIPTIYTALDVVSREQVGFIPAVARNTKADAAAKDQTVTAPVAPVAVTEDIVPGPSAPNTGDQNIGTVDVKITKSKMAPVKWNGEEQLALGPAGTYNTILADQFKQAFRALANEVDADLGRCTSTHPVRLARRERRRSVSRKTSAMPLWRVKCWRTMAHRLPISRWFSDRLPSQTSAVNSLSCSK